jgi:hypothetical protein
MNLVNCPECGNDVSERAATARPKQSRKTHPITWVAIAAMIPLLVWDVRQTLRESKLHNSQAKGFDLYISAYASRSPTKGAAPRAGGAQALKLS